MPCPCIFMARDPVTGYLARNDFRHGPPMPENDTLITAIVVLVAAVVGVAVLQRLRLGPVLGYLAAGWAIGPAGLGFVTDVEATRTLAEFGIVFLLFTVGLELPVERIRVMPVGVLWLGLTQILATGALLGLAAVALGTSPQTAVVVGAALSLSSTAVVLRLLADAGELNSRFGRAAFGVLIMQDLAVGPLLVVVLSLGGDQASTALALGFSVLKAVALTGAILVLGRYVVRPLFMAVAATRTPEVFAALTLLVILAAALASRSLGLSMAFGALLAGILLADSPYRHQVGAEIEPFRALLLGLFFMTVGMSLNVEFLGRQTATTLLIVVALIGGKAALISALAWMLHLPPGQALRFGLLLSQGGEFAFVLFAAAAGRGTLSPGAQQLLLTVVVLSMMLTPLLAVAGRWLERLAAGRGVAGPLGAEEAQGLDDHVIIAGYGRIGRAVARQLAESGIRWVAVDSDVGVVLEAQRAGSSVYYGDAWRLDVIGSLRPERARSVVVTVNNPRAALQLVATLHYVLPDIPIVARAYDDAHAEELRRAGAAAVVAEPTPLGDRLVDEVARAAFRRRP